MFYESDFCVPQNNRKYFEINDKTFNILISNDNDEARQTTQSVARSLLPLSYISSILAMKTINYRKNTIEPLNIINKIYCLFVIIMFLILTVIIKPIGWQQTANDPPLNILTKTFTLLQSTELLYAVFIISFSNSKNYVYLYQIIDCIDSHFGFPKDLYKKRFIFSAFMMILPPMIVGSIFSIRPFNINFSLSYLTFCFLTLHGVNVTFHAILIYIQVLVFNVILSRKLQKISNSKALTLKDDLFATLFKRLLYDLDNLPDTCYTWFELMQIYDKISDCVYIFNKIYATQILIMLNTWLLTTVLVICRSLTPALKHSAAIRTDLYYYTFINIRPLFLTKISESFLHERRKILTSLMHTLIYQEQDIEYHDQIRTMLELVQSKKLILSAIVCPVNLSIMFAFAGRVISYAVMFIQNFYINH